MTKYFVNTSYLKILCIHLLGNNRSFIESSSCDLPRAWLPTGFGKDRKLTGFAKRGNKCWQTWIFNNHFGKPLVSSTVACASERWQRIDRAQLCPWDNAAQLGFIWEIGFENLGLSVLKFKSTLVPNHHSAPLLQWGANNPVFSFKICIRPFET